MDKLNPATLELLVWTFGTLLFFVLTTATGFLIKLLSKLSEKPAQHEVRLERVEGDIDSIHDTLFHAQIRKK